MRSNEIVKPKRYRFGVNGYTGLHVAIMGLFFDFHALMNDELNYYMLPAFIWSNIEVKNKFDKITEAEFNYIDKLAELMIKPDKNFNRLLEIWENNKKYRIINTVNIKDLSFSISTRTAEVSP